MGTGQSRVKEAGTGPLEEPPADETPSWQSLPKDGDSSQAAILETDVEVQDMDTSPEERPLEESEQLVPTVFTWNHGGKQVYITGTFNQWRERIPLTRSGHEFNTILTLPRGQHQYKFIVDDEWSFAPDQPTMSDAIGNVNNFVEVVTLDNLDTDLGQDIGVLSASPPGSYSQQIPPDEVYDTDPPHLPPHLYRSVLDNTSPVSADPTILPVPQHVMLNHLYSLSKDSPDAAAGPQPQVMGFTTRYQSKFVTTVFCKPT